MSYKYLEKEFFNYNRVTLPIMLFVVSFLVWAYFAEIDEVVKAKGKVIPSSQLKNLQHLEGGIIAEILVSEGQTVKPGQLLYKIKNQYFKSQIVENQIEMLAKQAKQKRVEALLNEDSALVFSEEMKKKVPSVVMNEISIFKEIKNKTKYQLNILQDQLHQKRSLLRELEIKVENLQIEYDLARKNMKIQDSLKEKRVISEEKYLQHLTNKQKIFTLLEEARYSIPAVKQEIEEFTSKIENEKAQIRSELLQELNEVVVEVKKLRETLKTHNDRELRTGIVSPVHGIVNKLNYHTIGGIIKPGESVAEISPIEDELMIEAKVRASDRAYIYPGQKVSIEVTAYNFARYGMITGELIGISPDSTVDEKSGESYYSLRIKANRYEFDTDSPILIGMTVNVSILTAKRTVLEYILKPIRDIRYKALQEY